MNRFPLSFSSLRARWRAGLPLRYTMMVVVVVGVTLPALLLLTLEQELAEKSQKALLAQSETALMKIGSVSIAEPMWVVDRVALDAAAVRLRLGRQTDATMDSLSFVALEDPGAVAHDSTTKPRMRTVRAHFGRDMGQLCLRVLDIGA